MIGTVKHVDLKRHNESQIQEIQRHKWIESEKAGRDLGQEAVLDWIHRYAESFRAARHPQVAPSRLRGWKLSRLKEWLARRWG
jgi:hypothetical protein